METIDTPKINWTEVVREYQRKLESFLNSPIPPRVMEGSVNIAIDFKEWAVKARRAINSGKRHNKTFVAELSNLNTASSDEKIPRSTLQGKPRS